MTLLNYKVTEYNYDDWRSGVAYGIGILLIVYPELGIDSMIDGVF